jgi:hypothetical protein
MSIYSIDCGILMKFKLVFVLTNIGRLIYAIVEFGKLFSGQDPLNMFVYC